MMSPLSQSWDFLIFRAWDTILHVYSLVTGMAEAASWGCWMTVHHFRLTPTCLSLSIASKNNCCFGSKSFCGGSLISIITLATNSCLKHIDKYHVWTQKRRNALLFKANLRTFVFLNRHIGSLAGMSAFPGRGYSQRTCCSKRHFLWK